MQLAVRLFGFVSICLLFILCSMYRLNADNNPDNTEQNGRFGRRLLGNVPEDYDDVLAGGKEVFEEDVNPEKEGEKKEAPHLTRTLLSVEDASKMENEEEEEIGDVPDFVHIDEEDEEFSDDDADTSIHLVDDANNEKMNGKIEAEKLNTAEREQKKN